MRALLITLVLATLLNGCNRRQAADAETVAKAVADSVALAREARQQRLARQNNPGTRANDFTYFTADSTAHRLYDITTPYTLLFFYNPDCPACKQYAWQLMNSPVLNVKLDFEEVTVLAVYIDHDLALWYNSLKDYPKNWTLAHDNDEHIYKNDIYDVHAIPSIYLLDHNKNVLLKDCLDIKLIERYLLNLD